MLFRKCGVNLSLFVFGFMCYVIGSCLWYMFAWLVACCDCLYLWLLSMGIVLILGGFARLWCFLL